MHSNNNVKHFYSMSTVAEILMATYLVRFQQTHKHRFEDHLMDPYRSKCELGLKDIIFRCKFKIAHVHKWQWYFVKFINDLYVNMIL